MVCLARAPAAELEAVHMLRELKAVHAYASCSGETRRGAVRCGGEGGGWRWEEAHEVRGLAAAPAGAYEKPAGQLDVWGR